MPDATRTLDAAMGSRLKPVILRAIDEAARRGAANVEAEHLLLVISAGDDASARALAEFGLDHAAVEAALDAERERALEVAGVAPVARGAAAVHAPGAARLGRIVPRGDAACGLPRAP